MTETGGILKALNKNRNIEPKNVKKFKGKLRSEDISIISINARGLGGKKKSIEEILKNNGIDIAVISEISVKHVPKFKGYKQFVETRGHMHGICILVRN